MVRSLQVVQTAEHQSQEADFEMKYGPQYLDCLNEGYWRLNTHKDGRNMELKLLGPVERKS